MSAFEGSSLWPAEPANREKPLEAFFERWKSTLFEDEEADPEAALETFNLERLGSFSVIAGIREDLREAREALLALAPAVEALSPVERLRLPFADTPLAEAVREAKTDLREYGQALEEEYHHLRRLERKIRGLEGRVYGSAL